MLKNIILLLFFPFFVQSQSLEKRDSLGVFIKKTFQNTAFPDIQRENGHRYQNKLYTKEHHYSDSSVLIFIPKKFNTKEKNDIIFHFHGWYNNVDSVPVQFLLPEQLYQSGKNALLILPQGPKNAPDSYGGKLEQKRTFELLVKEIIEFLYQEKHIVSNDLGNIILSGHSGAYRVMAHILKHGGVKDHIKEVWLFDGLYSQETKFLNWIKSNDGGFVNIYTKEGGTFSLSKTFEQTLLNHKIEFDRAEDGLTDKILQSSKRVKSIYSPLGHNDVMHKRKQFKRLIEHSNYLQ